MKNSSLSDGWHTLAGYNVLVQSNTVVRGMGYNRRGEKVLSLPYIVSTTGQEIACVGITLESFKQRARRGSVSMRPLAMVQCQ